MRNVYLERQKKLFKQLSGAGISAAVLKDFEGSKNSSVRYLTGHPQDAVLFVFSGLGGSGCGTGGVPGAVARSTRNASANCGTDVAKSGFAREEHPEAQETYEAQGATLLLPWDINLARKVKAYSTEIIPYTDFNRNFSNAVASVFSGKAPQSILRYVEKVGSKAKLAKTNSSKRSSAKNNSNKEIIEFLATSSWLEIESLKKLLPDKTIVCREDGIDLILSQNRMIKDKKEVSIYREAAKITDTIIDEIEKFVKKSLRKPAAQITETEIALLIEKLVRESGAEGTGFKTLVAGHERSWAIHPYPNFSSAPVSKTGTTIVDFGVKYKGYTTDVTITFAGKNLSDKQKEIINLVSEAANRAEKMLKPGVSVQSISEDIMNFFGQRGYSMPHALGHGIGLDVHETPILRIGNGAKSCSGESASLEEGMVLAIEPGLYDPLHGGVRLENDYLITKKGCEKITNARIIFL
ncbi:MAG: aminopeptidase P family protein [Spirochaetes bacterium]|nr:aminopeptidase P family protein [Spirochaetota bacterium]